MSKSIYTFTVNKVAKVSEKRIEKYVDESGIEKERTITEEVEKQVPVEILIKKPNRKQIQEAEMAFSIEMSRCIKTGILTKAMLLNKYSDNGGLFSEKESKELNSLYSQLEKAQLEIVNLNIVPEDQRTEDQKNQLSQKQNSIIELRKEIVERETSYLTLFNHTADTKAQNKCVLWYVLNMSFYKDPSQNHADFVPIFKGSSFEEKEESLYELEEKEDEIYTLTYGKLASVISFWYFTGKIDKEEFDKVVKEQNE